MTARAEQLTFDLGHATSFAEDDFIVSEVNRLAFEHIRAYPNWPVSLTLITGPAKTGKSHLAGIWLNLSGGRQVSPETLKQAAADPDTPLLIEDADRAGYEEHALFHLLNQSMRDHRPVLMTARAPVPEWPFTTNDVKSRARLAAHFPVEAADDTQLSQMFVKLLADRQLRVEPKTIAYLVARMERSPEEVVALTALLDSLALSKGRAIGRGLAAEALVLRDAARQGQADPDGELE